MRNRLAFCLSLLLVVLAGCAGQSDKDVSSEAPGKGEASGAPVTAYADLQPKSGSSLTGRAKFVAQDGTVRMLLEVRGGSPGSHAVHLHEVGDCSSDDGKSAGGHWNPTEAPHGRWGEPPHHLGDVGNMTIGEDGTGTITLESEIWTIGPLSETDIVGRSVIVHAGEDDFATQPTGAAGGRIGCGVIQTGT